MKTDATVLPAASGAINRRNETENGVKGSISMILKAHLMLPLVPSTGFGNAPIH